MASLQPVAPELSVEPRSGRFAVVSDLQRTSRAEVWRESNRDERDRIVAGIAAGAPDFVAMLGDLVFRGSSPRDWEEFDRIASPLRQGAIPVFPILGNHDYWVFARAALPNFFGRFPHLAGRRWYTLRYGPVTLVCLDSNRRWMSRGAWEEQTRWFAAELARLDADESVHGILALVHHPPYTNSTVTGDELHVQSFFVPAFLRSEKTLAMLSGHVHSYERFSRQGRTFLVTGGGGGPRIKLAREGRRMRHADDLFAGPAVRFFHFLNFQLVNDGIEVETVGLAKGARELEPMDRFKLCYRSGS
jgi:3',5'-cyclic AMP phosphodiesterase CpdA